MSASVGKPESCVPVLLMRTVERGRLLRRWDTIPATSSPSACSPRHGVVVRASLALLAVLAMLLVASAHRTRWVAMMQSDHAGDTAAVMLRVRDACQLILQTSNGLGYNCRGRWRCSGKACPARRGKLIFRRLDDPFAAQDVELLWRHGACSAHFVGIPQPGFDVRPFHWWYGCFTGSPVRQSDSGTFILDLKR